MRKILLKSAELLLLAMLCTDVNARDRCFITTHFFQPIQKLVKGKVQNEEGQPLKGASIIANGSNVSAIANANGEFEIGVAANEVLIISYIGYQTQEIGYNGGDFLLITLLFKKNSLEEVVVEANTGYQKLPKDRITGSFDIISAKQFSKKAPLKLTERLEGLAPGLLLINGKDNGSDDGLTIRGVSTLYGTKRPLIVVDNFPIEGDINSINPNDVVAVTVLKDAAAASIWGGKAANGVIVITTKNGAAGPVKLNYINSFQLSSKPNLKKLSRLSSREDVDIELQLQDKRLYDAVKRNPTFYSFNTVNALYFDSIDNIISPEIYLAKINELKNTDNAQQIKDLLMQLPFTQSHTISLNGGNDISQFYASLLYTRANTHNLRDKTGNISAFIKSSSKISSKLKLNLMFNHTRSNGSSAPVSAREIFASKPYQLLQDEEGNALALVCSSDSRLQDPSNIYTIKQRNDWGLFDETYYPLLEINRRDVNSSNNLTRLQSELRYTIVKGITANLSYQYENANAVTTDFKHQNSAAVAKLLNDYTAPQYNGDSLITDSEGKLLSPTLHIPSGGIINESRGEDASYTLRGAVELNRSVGSRDNISILAGGERIKHVKAASILTLYGYEPNSLNSVDINENISDIVTRVLQRASFDYTPNRLTYSENRYISTFANAAYTINKKYVLSGSLRMDITNLFGTDPKYRYKPLWSTGLSWNMAKEGFLSGKLFTAATLRATFGINGNVPKNSGPFILAEATNNYINNLPSLVITSPANAQLRWEATYVFNLGFDFNILHRVSGKFDYYNRNTKGLLANQLINPIYGFGDLLLNSGSMVNRGFEIELQSRNITRKNFEWSTTFMFSHTKNKITKVATNELYNTPYYRAGASGGGPLFVEGYSYESLFSFKFAGLTDKGQVSIYNGKGGIDYGDGDDLISDLNALEYSGTQRPVNNASLGQQLRFKNFEFSCMFVAYGNYYLRRHIADARRGASINSLDAIMSKAWKKPGDEAITNIPSIFWNPDRSSYYAMGFYKNYLNINVFNASYIKLREAILIYNLPEAAFNKLKQINGLQISIQGRNLWTVVKNNRGVDPEAFAGGSPDMPIMPTFIFGLNINL